MEFDTQNGLLKTYELNGTPLIESGGALQFARAQPDNERRQKPPQDKIWNTAGKKAVVTDVNVEQQSSAVKVEILRNIPAVKASVATVYTVFATGEVAVETAFNLQQTPKKLLPAHYLSMEWKLPKLMQQIEWFGRDEETYRDRAFEPIGRFKSTLDEEWVDYSKPQENGNKRAVRWAALTDADGHGLLVVADGDLLDIGARNYTHETMRKADYSFQMKRADSVILNVIAAQQGVGGINSWGRTPLEKHQLQKKMYAYASRLLPVVDSVDEALARRVALGKTDVEKLSEN